MRRINPLSGKITFINDDPSAPSPDLPMSEKLAALVESVMKSTNLSININSTTGGTHSKRSFHYHGMAVDINRIESKRIDDKLNAENVQRFQNAIAAHPYTAECFCPFINIRKRGTHIE